MNIFNKFKQIVGMKGGFIPKSLITMTTQRRTKRRTKRTKRTMKRTIKKTSK